MSALSHKIDFAIIFSVKNANPNGDPLNGNRPRTDYDGYGEVTDVCLKRKIRDRLQEQGQSIFVQCNEKKTDGMTSLQNRAYAKPPIGLGKEAFDTKKISKDATAKQACEHWFDVRAFGQVFAFGKDDDAAGVSIAIRGPVTIQSAFSLDPISITSTQITKSVNGEGNSDIKKSPDTMGMKHRVDEAVYVTYGAITPQLADKTGFSDNDAKLIKAVLPKLFEGDASSARPEGSMAVQKVIWWQHNCKAGQYSSARVHGLLTDLIETWKESTTENDILLSQLKNLQSEYAVSLQLEGLTPEIIDGF
jgi:CRISPR-associated protein Csd2